MVFELGRPVRGARGDKTAIELFVTVVQQGWETGLRKFENGKSR